MAQWSNTASESGILRKNKPKENHDDLLVFGYACKLFRDDDKALYIDQGKHLIPWMGDDNLKIDRYDCRGALSDINLYESSREGYDTIRWLGLNESERKIEQLCDKERYYALEINEEEERMYKEEEEKRLKANQFQYSYDVPEKPSQPTEMGPTARDDTGGGEDDEVFVPPPNLDIPIDIEIPKTVKENARIEKTALFVNKQGLQMEILIKAKQSDNPQFGFLNQGHTLYKYYRHILAAIKNGLYQIITSTTSKNDTNKEEDGDNPNDDHYLHPSLQSTTPTTATTSINTATTNDDVVDDDTSAIPTPPYKPSANCLYSQLVNRIQGSLNEQQHNNQQQQFNDNMKLLPPIKSQEAYSQLTYEQQQYYQYYYMAQYYEYYRQLAQYQQNGGQQQQQQQVQPPEIHLDPTIQNYIQQMAYMQYQQQQQQANSVNPYAQIVNNLNNLTNCQQSETLPSSIDQQQSFGVETRIVTKSSPKYDDEDDIKKPLLSLAQYGSDSDDDDDDGNNNGGGGDGGNYKVPIGEIKIVIDKMASYVAKNGEQFEEIVRAKGDPRFEFLNNNHDYYQYYRKKIKESLSNNKNTNNSSNERLEEKREIKMVAVPLQKPKEKKVIAPVSFSIKKPKDDGPKEIKSALPIEESDDEEDADKDIETKNDSDNNNNKDNDKIDNKLENNENDKKDEPILQINETIRNSNNNNNNNNNNNKDGIFDTDDPILEMIDLTDDIDDKQRDIKRAEDKIKDKLALAAREKLVLVNRDNRALQLERKRKAAAFLALKSAETLNVTFNNNEESRVPDPVETMVDDIAKKRSDDDDNDDDDDDDVDEDEQLEDKRRSKRKKSHKRKHSKSKYDSKSGRKKSKKKRRRSSSGSSTNSRLS